MPRMLKVKGVPGLDVWNPHVAFERHVGKDPNGNCIEEELADDPHLRKALRKGSLVAADEATALAVGCKLGAQAHSPASPAKKGN